MKKITIAAVAALLALSVAACNDQVGKGKDPARGEGGNGASLTTTTKVG